MNKNNEAITIINRGIEELRNLNILKVRRLAKEEKIALYKQLAEEATLVDSVTVNYRDLGQKFRYLEKAFTLLYALEQDLGEEALQHSNGEPVEIIIE